MRKVIVDKQTGTLLYLVEGECAAPEGTYFVSVGPDFSAEHLATLAARDNVVVTDPVEALSLVKSKKITLIKKLAEERINALVWRLERASEREALGVTGVETVADVMQEREQIRQQSDAAEEAVMAIGSVQAVREFAW